MKPKFEPRKSTCKKPELHERSGTRDGMTKLNQDFLSSCSIFIYLPTTTKREKQKERNE